MAKYSDIKGFTVQTLSSDTATSGIAAGSWASGGSLNTARGYFNVSQVGTQTATLAVGGYTTVVLANTEQYNGSSWTEVADQNEGRSTGYGSGVVTAAWFGGGFAPDNTANTETWDGSSWTEVNDMNTARRHGGAFGGNTNGIAASGFISPGNRNSSNVESWDGTNWTEVAEMNTARQTSALVFGGYTTTYVANTEEFTAGDFEIKTVTTS